MRDYARKLPSSEKKSDHASGRWFSNFMLILALIFASVAVYQFIQNHLPTQNIKSKLIEHFAGRIKKALYEEFPQLQGLSVKISKPGPPVNGIVEKLSVTL